MKKLNNNLIRSTRKCEVRAAQEVPLRANRSESPDVLHKRLLKTSLWDSLNKNRKEPMSFALKINPTSAMVHGRTRLGGDKDVVPPSMNRVLAVEYMTRHKVAD